MVGRQPLGERVLTIAEQQARRAARKRPGTTAYASQLISDYEALVNDLWEAVVRVSPEMQDRIKTLAERAEARHAHLAVTLKKPHLADPYRLE